MFHLFYSRHFKKKIWFIHCHTESISNMQPTIMLEINCLWGINNLLLDDFSLLCKTSSEYLKDTPTNTHPHTGRHIHTPTPTWSSCGWKNEYKFKNEMQNKNKSNNRFWGSRGNSKTFKFMSEEQHFVVVV